MSPSGSSPLWHFTQCFSNTARTSCGGTSARAPVACPLTTASEKSSKDLSAICKGATDVAQNDRSSAAFFDCWCSREIAFTRAALRTAGTRTGVGTQGWLNPVGPTRGYHRLLVGDDLDFAGLPVAEVKPTAVAVSTLDAPNTRFADWNPRFRAEIGDRR